MKELTGKQNGFMAHFEKLGDNEISFIRGGKRLPSNVSFPGSNNQLY